jgi:hypothetical protein
VRIHADDSQRAARTQHSAGLGDEGFWLAEMMKGIYAVNQVEHGLGERQENSIAIRQPGRAEQVSSLAQHSRRPI